MKTYKVQSFKKIQFCPKVSKFIVLNFSKNVIFTFLCMHKEKTLVLEPNVLSQWECRIFLKNKWWVNFIYNIMVLIQETLKMVCKFLVGCDWKNSVSANRILGFLSQLYLRSNWINHCGFLHTEIDWKEIKRDWKIFGWMKLKRILAN